MTTNRSVPGVALVMPAWNPDPVWLHEAVACALDDLACHELVVVDDESDVPVSEVLHDVADPRLSVVRVARGGPYAARNVGVAATSSPFVRFVDADDVADPGSTAALLARAAAEPGAIAYGGTLMCDEALRPIAEVATSTVDGDATAACLCGAFSVFHVSMVFPRDVVVRCGGWPVEGFTVSGDWDFVLRAVELGPVRPVPGVMTRYRRHPTSIMSSARVEAGSAARRRVIAGYVARHPDQAGGPLHRQALAAMHLSTASALDARGDLRGALRSVARGARYDLPGAASALRRLAGRRVRAVVSR